MTRPTTLRERAAMRPDQAPRWPQDDPAATAAGDRAGGARRQPAAAAVVATFALAALLAPLFPGSAHAHHGYTGPARLYIESVRLTPGPDGWQARAALNDTASGEAAPGFLVEVTGVGPQGASFGPAPLGDTDADGRYEAALGAVPPGDWSLTLHVGDLPGGEERVIPITRTWPITLHAGQPLDVLGGPTQAEANNSSGDGAVVLPLLVGIGAAATLVALVVAAARRRRHSSAAPYQAQASPGA